MSCFSCPKGEVLACPECKHDVHRHSTSTGCGECADLFVPGKSLLADVCIAAPPFIGSLAPVRLAR